MNLLLRQRALKMEEDIMQDMEVRRLITGKMMTLLLLF